MKGQHLLGFCYTWVVPMTTTQNSMHHISGRHKGDTGLSYRFRSRIVSPHKGTFIFLFLFFPVVYFTRGNPPPKKGREGHWGSHKFLHPAAPKFQPWNARIKVPGCRTRVAHFLCAQLDIHCSPSSTPARGKGSWPGILASLQGNIWARVKI